MFYYYAMIHDSGCVRVRVCVNTKIFFLSSSSSVAKQKSVTRIIIKKKSNRIWFMNLMNEWWTRKSRIHEEKFHHHLLLLNQARIFLRFFLLSVASVLNNIFKWIDWLIDWLTDKILYRFISATKLIIIKTLWKWKVFLKKKKITVNKKKCHPISVDDQFNLYLSQFLHFQIRTN